MQSRAVRSKAVQSINRHGLMIAVIMSSIVIVDYNTMKLANKQLDRELLIHPSPFLIPLISSGRDR